MRRIAGIAWAAGATVVLATVVVTVAPTGAGAACAGIRDLSATPSEVLGVRADGTAWTWGGLGSRPAAPLPLTGVRSIASGGFHHLALDGNGLVWAWGDDGFGQLGDGATGLDRPFPTPVRGLPAVKAVAAGQLTSFAVGLDGSVWAWGRNTEGHLGDGTRDGRGLPVRTGSLTGVVAVAAGDFHALALRNDGTVWGWGFNSAGEVGDGTSTMRLSPVQVTGLTGVVAIAAGARHSLAVKSDGTVWAWGYNGSYQLGDGTFFSRGTPVRATGVTGAVGVAAGIYHSVAMTGTGAVYTWGNNVDGQIGDGSTTNRQTAYRVLGGLPAVAMVAGGGNTSYAVTPDGDVWGWGLNGSGQLADGSTTDHHTPVRAQLAAACYVPYVPSTESPGPTAVPTVPPVTATPTTVATPTPPSTGAPEPEADCRFARGATQVLLVGYALSTHEPAPVTTSIRCTLSTPARTYTAAFTLPGRFVAATAEGPLTPDVVTVCTYAESVYPDGSIGVVDRCVT